MIECNLTLDRAREVLQKIEREEEETSLLEESNAEDRKELAQLLGA